MKNIMLLLLMFAFGSAFGQGDFLKDGNALLGQKKYPEAEAVFRKGIKSSPTDLKLKNQLAFALMSQNKYADAEKLITEVLKKEPANKAALWFGGLNNLNNKSGNARKAVQYFEKVKPLMEASKTSLVDLNIGKSYKKLLFSEGLTNAEIDKMQAAFSAFVEMQPDAEDNKDVKEFLKFVKGSRPNPKIRKMDKWQIAAEDQGAQKQIDQFLKENKK
ncbi:tetratricopeptide repeat protein [Chryseobacterium sp.]|uniref:tetratricopeptide repeat protein n=1 Tax=Chryseobacterium sp. TaxID=1871047 RepID=UPI0011CA7A9D|nr:tetratricopeptide repeat protein [Chryseobacterium sp.]TXF78905.1 tetratricopeptide repeat protein [Chryseobacterium sp.]